MRIPRPRSLAGQLFAMQVVLVAAIVAGCALFAYVTDRSQAEETARLQSTATATAVARSPSVIAAARSAHPSEPLQPYTERLRRDAGVTFVVIMAPDGTRWTHPEPGEIGKKYLGHIDEALKGKIYSEKHLGVLGPSVRTVAPIYDNGKITGLVSAGITIQKISEKVSQQVAALLGVAGAALTLGGLGTYVINVRLRRHTHGMNAAELSRMHDYHEAALHAVREGLLMLDGRRRIALVNDAARELLGLDDDAVGRPVAELGLPAPLTGALLAAEPRVDEVHLTADRVIVVNTSPVVGGEQRGTVVTLRDHTELQALSGELDSERGFTQALRSQAHEAANRLHTVVSLIELGRADEAVDFATAELELAQVLTDRVVGAVGEPVLAALLLGKAAQANERGVELVLAEDSRIDDGVLPPSLPARDLVTILGNLIDNAVDAASEAAAGGRDAGALDGVDGQDRVIVHAVDGRDHDTVTPVDGRDHDTVTPANGQDHVIVTARDPVTAADGRAVQPLRARVTVTARADRGELLLRVADTGAGVDPADAEEVFRRGWSTHGAGRGLGLALVRQAAHRSRGTVLLTEGPDGGAEFTVRLPLHTAEVRA
ncbi:ATP-binding protein [Streptomyces sp. NBC_01210]|uniref:sensor histidine kinase n=1 Tax=Streptomyces sp. NBC_01210 TaxID=2903774 RepID=UPI002E0FF9A3|nr:ATP-binding protein [Streptomyces sp. NBC_01210]